MRFWRPWSPIFSGKLWHLLRLITESDLYYCVAYFYCYSSTTVLQQLALLVRLLLFTLTTPTSIMLSFSLRIYSCWSAPITSGFSTICNVCSFIRPIYIRLCAVSFSLWTYGFVLFEILRLVIIIIYSATTFDEQCSVGAYGKFPNNHIDIQYFIKPSVICSIICMKMFFGKSNDCERLLL